MHKLFADIHHQSKSYFISISSDKIINDCITVQQPCGLQQNRNMARIRTTRGHLHVQGNINALMVFLIRMFTVSFESNYTLLVYDGYNEERHLSMLTPASGYSLYCLVPCLFITYFWLTNSNLIQFDFYVMYLRGFVCKWIISTYKQKCIPPNICCNWSLLYLPWMLKINIFQRWKI